MRLSLPRRGLRWYFDHNDGRLIDKWDHYFEVYEAHLRRFRGRRPVVLELGVSHGGSLQMWQYYFGRGSTVVGVDIQPRVAELSQPGIDVHVGDQSDAGFLAGLVDRYGGFDVVIDDGSHRFEHQQASLDALWGAVRVGGVYLVEDVHSSYMEAYGNELGAEPTFISATKQLLDELHGYWHGGGWSPDSVHASAWTSSLGAIHVYDSIVVLDKAERPVPRRRMTGRPSFDTINGSPAEQMIDADHRAQLDSLNRPLARLRRLRRAPVATLRGYVRRRR